MTSARLEINNRVINIMNEEEGYIYNIFSDNLSDDLYLIKYDNGKTGFAGKAELKLVKSPKILQ
jgi:hypothetical protein